MILSYETVATLPRFYMINVGDYVFAKDEKKEKHLYKVWMKSPYYQTVYSSLTTPVHYPNIGIDFGGTNPAVWLYVTDVCCQDPYLLKTTRTFTEEILEEAYLTIENFINL